MSLAADSRPPGEYYCPTCEKTFGVGERCPTDGTKLVKLAAPVDPLIGRDLDGFTILEKLGQGGMGAVYRAAQHSVGREVAIKVVSSHLVADPDVIKRFLREAKLASRLSHPNAVGVIDFGQTDDGVFYLAMELVTGRTLDQVIKAERVFKPERVVRIGTQVCDALEGAHALQIVHRDLKPANIMLLTPGRDLVKVLDFGLAKSVAADEVSTTMTNAGALLGTPAFMPPELALGQPCDGRADLYSLGVVLYLLGSGRLPFQSESAHELIAMHGTEAAPPMTGVPPALGRVIDRMLAKDPALRYQTAADCREALEAALENRYLTPVSGVPTPGDTNPSLGPFPATSAQFAGFSTPVPNANRRSATEIDRLVNQKTMAATDVQMPTLRRRSPVLPIIGALLVTAAAAGVAFVMLGGKQDKPATPAIKEPSLPEARPTVAPPDHPAAVVEKPVVEKPAVEKTPEVIEKTPEVVEKTPEKAEPVKPDRRPKSHRVIKKDPVKKDPVKKEPVKKDPDPPVVKETPKEPAGTTAGSAKKLPF